MGTVRIAIVALGFVLVGAAGALAGADTEPVIAVPGRPGVPIVINGQDVSGAVIEGDWGLARGHAGITIIRPIHPWRRNWGPACGQASCGPPVARFYPGTGRPPRVGRLEVVPPANRALPPRAETYQRFWGIESAPVPATIEPTDRYEMPPVIVGPLRDRDGGRHGPRPAR
jgi:hypothetical protein